MAGISVGFAKCFIIFMAVVILAQGVIYLGLGIWGIAIRSCQPATDISENPFKFAMNLIYFVEEDCGTPDLVYNEHVIPINMGDWQKSYEVTHREYIFMVTYAVVSGLWIATSLLIIITICNTTTKIISGIIYWPWFLCVIAGCILDVVASVYHGLDITKTTSLDDAFEFVGASIEDPSPEGTLWSLLQQFGVYFSTPSIVLLLISCRVVLIWLLNIFGCSFCLSLSHMLASQTEQKVKAAAIVVTSNSQAPTRQQTPQPVMQQIQPVIQETPMEQQYSYPEQIRPKPLPIVIPAQNVEQVQRQDSQMYMPNDRTTVQSPVMVLPPQQPDINTYRTTEAHPDRLNYPATESQSPTPRAASPVMQQFAVTSPLNNRYSEMYPTAPPNPRVSQELRNQMPWSYTSMVNKPPPPPRKPQLQVQIYPQIPEPDYIEH